MRRLFLFVFVKAGGGLLSEPPQPKYSAFPCPPACRHHIPLGPNRCNGRDNEPREQTSHRHGWRVGEGKLGRERRGSAMYHERQHLMQCAMHALNNLFQEHWADRAMMERIALDL